MVFSFTRGGKQDRIKLHDLAGRTLYAPADFKKESGAEKLRPLYVPYKLHSLTLEGDADLYGQSSYLDAMHESFEGKAVTLADYPDGSSVSEHLPVKEMTDYTAFFPVWFLSFRKGNRIAYAAATVSEPASRVLHGAFRACSPKGPAFRSLRF